MNLRSPKFGQLLAVALVLSSATACNQQEMSQTPVAVSPTGSNTKELPSPTPTVGSTPSPTSTPRQNPTPAPTASPIASSGTYPSCLSSDADHICIGLKLISYQDSSGVPVLTESDAITLVNGMNTVWNQCNIAFQLEVFEIVDPTTKGLNYSPDWQTETYTIRDDFADKSRFLVAAVGPWTSATIAVTTMPGSGVYGTIVDKQYAKNPLTVGHELGHYQGLYHVDDTSNLMSAFIGPNTKALTSDQCATTRKTDLSNWTAMLRKP